MPHIVIVYHGQLPKLEQILPVLADAIGVKLTDRAAHDIVGLIDRRAFSMDEFPDVPGTFQHCGDHLVFLSDPGRIDVDISDESIDFVHPDDQVVNRVRQYFAQSA